MRQIAPICIGLTAALLVGLMSTAASARSSAASTKAPDASAKTYCPRILHRATRLILVAVPTMDTAKATMRTFVRKSPAAAWMPQATAEPAVVGARGLGWGHRYVSYARRGEPIKKEGDERTPAGLYRLGATFGFDKDDRPGHMRLKPGAHYCVHDTKSQHYGRIVTKAKAGADTGGEDMGTFPLYKRGIVVDYAPHRQAKAGSCIFLHVWGREGEGTAGCVALPEERVAHLQEWAEGRHTVMAVVSEDTVARFGNCLPTESVAHKGPAALPVPNPKRRGPEGQRAELAR
jgi:L,D-peptidoglycan transpeptidase YkuD (ErfK/YbiS/YcfS/YnhG family)